ncbi:NAD(P)/FAD-dependent oxidoreductase [Tamlana crocina]
MDKNTLTVEGKTIRADKIVIATGKVSRPLNIQNTGYLYTSDDFLLLKKLPKSVAFIGGGYVGMELAHMAARYGCKVTIIEKEERILKTFDADLVDQLVEYSKEMGINMIFNAEIDSVEKLRKNYCLNYSVNGQNQTLKARMIFNTSGRIPAIGELDLEKGNVKYNNKGVVVDAYLKNPSNSSVYACGDVSAHSLPLSPLSGMEAKVVAHNILNKTREKLNVSAVPSAVFTLPNLASVGLSETEAKKKYKNIIVKHDAVPYWYNSKRVNNKIYAYKILINKRTNLIVGAHILGPNAAESINLFTLSMHQQLTVKSLREMVFVYPTWAYDIKNML